MLILLLLAKGWAVTRLEISKKDWIVLMIMWIPYCIFNIFLYIWNRVEVDVIDDIDEYQTWPGWIVLACRYYQMNRTKFYPLIIYLHSNKFLILFFFQITHYVSIFI